MKNTKAITIVSYCLVALATLYAGLRAWALPITGDEASSFLDLQYMNPGYFLGSTPNSHLLNTAWIKLVSTVSVQPFALRFYSVFSTALFGVYLIRMFVSRNEHRLIIPVLLLVFLHSYLIDFFSLARGYGQAIAWMAVSLYYISCYSTEKTIRTMLFATGAAGLACLASYTLLNFYLVVLLWFCLMFLLDAQYRRVFLLLPHGLLVLGVAYLLSGFNSHLGGAWIEKHFWPDAWFSLINVGSNFSTALTVGVAWFSIIIIVLAYFLLLKKWWRADDRRRYLVSFPGFLFCAVTGVFLFHLLQHQLFAAPYPSVRGIVYYHVLIVLFVSYALVDSNASRWLTLSIGATALLVSSVNFLYSAGITNSKEAPFSNDALIIINDIQTFSKGDSVSLGLSPIFADAFNYYRIIEHRPWKNIGSGFGVAIGKGGYYSDVISIGEYDCLLLKRGEMDAISTVWETQELNYYPVSDSYLLKVIKRK